MQKRKNSSTKEIAAAFLLLIMVVTVTFSASYAVLSAQIKGQKSYSLAIGDFDFSFKNEQNSISLLNAYPMTDEEGKQLEDYKFSVTNTGDYKGDYKISLVEAEEKKSQCTNCTFLDPSMLRYELTKEGVAQEPKDVAATTLLDEGTLKPKESANYELRIWLKQEATVAEEGKIYYGKIKVEAVQSTQNTLGTVSDYAFDTNNLGESCKTYDDGTDTFLVGQCSKNYVWYSGKLWRVVLKNNETGNVKMVTDNAMTIVPYNNKNNTMFEDSYVDQWLQQEFLPTLHDYHDYLVENSVWDATLDDLDMPARPNGTTTVNRPVGLLNAYEYYTTYNNSDGLATYETGYLNNNTYWWLITPSSSSDMVIVYYNGSLIRYAPNFAYSVRPTVNLKSEIQIISGGGTESNPYKLVGDAQETVNGTTLLNTRYSGEYIEFNNELYRIVGTENNLAKITAVDKPSVLSSNQFHSSTGVTSFASASIKTDLESYYQGLAENTKNMIEPNTTWYLKMVGDGTNYKASICSSVELNTDINHCTKTTNIALASIGLPRIGEIFTSQITREPLDFFWTLTPYSSSAVRQVNNMGASYINGFPTNTYGARPSMYLKSNVVIASTNTGDGTYEKPYDIELGS